MAQGESKSRVVCGDALTVLRTIDAESVDMVITSPPYY
jgi:DNA modification methylase